MDMLLEDKNANWSYEGADMLITYLEELEEEMDEDIYMDVVGIRCQYSEYSFKDLLIDYAHEFNGYDIDDLEEDEVIDYVKHLEKKGIVLLIDKKHGIAITDNDAR